MKLFCIPPKEQFPPNGGVRTHLIKLYSHLANKVELVDSILEADIVHVESAWAIPQTKKPSVFVTHGGFVPSPIPTVINNLKQATKIVSVSQWIVDKYFPEHQEKTIVIPNGVDLEDFSFNPDLTMKDYVLYAKEWNYYFDDFQKLVETKPDKQFVTTIWPDSKIPPNVTYIGLQPKERINAWIKNAGCLLLTGSEVCPTMLLESWACKVPVLALGIDGSEEIMANYMGGYLYQDFDDLLRGLDFVYENKTELGERGFEGVQNYQWKDLVNRYVEVYERLLDV